MALRLPVGLQFSFCGALCQMENCRLRGNQNASQCSALADSTADRHARSSRLSFVYGTQGTHFVDSTVIEAFFVCQCDEADTVQGFGKTKKILPDFF